MNTIAPRPINWQAAARYLSESRRFPGYTQAELDALRCVCGHIHPLTAPVHGSYALHQCAECACTSQQEVA